MASTRAESLKLVVKNVLRKPATLAIAVVSVAGALIANHPWPLAAGAAAEAGMVLFYLQNERSLRQALREERQRIRDRQTEGFEDIVNTLEAESRFRIRNILQLQKEITEATEDPETAGYVKGTLDMSAGQVNALTEKAVRLAQKKKELQKYLDRNDEPSIERYIEELRGKLSTATDPVTQAQYQQALTAKAQELEDSRAIKQAAKRIDGQLETIECSFAGLKARIIRLKSAEITQLTDAWQQMGDELQSLNTAVDTLEQSVNEALAI